MAIRKARVHVTEELYNDVMVMVNMKVVPNADIKRIFKLSTATLGRVKQSKNWADYKAICVQAHKPKPTQIPFIVTPRVIAATEVDLPSDKTKTDKRLDIILAEVKELREAVQWIADNAVVKVVEKNPSKRRFF